MADENGKTSIEGVYAGGDIVTGQSTLISAMVAGKKSSKSYTRIPSEQKVV